MIFDTVKPLFLKSYISFLVYLTVEIRIDLSKSIALNSSLDVLKRPFINVLEVNKNAFAERPFPE